MPSIPAYPNCEYEVITTTKALRRVLPDLINADRFGIDIETTGLDPHLDQIRLIQIAVPQYPVYLFDLFALPPKATRLLKPVLQGKALKIGQYLKFEWQFLTAKGFGFDAPFFDCQLAFKTLIAGLRNIKSSLQSITRRILGFKLDKALQQSNWTQSLTDKQLQYAANDSACLLDLEPKLSDRLRTANLLDTAEREFRCLPGIAQMELWGMRLDLDRWKTISHQMEAQYDAATKALKTLRRANLKQLSLLPEVTDLVNLNSNSQVLQALQCLNVRHRDGTLITSTSKRELVPLSNLKNSDGSLTYPILQSLLLYRKLSRIHTTFDTSLPQWIHPHTGRLHPTYYQWGARSGRTSCRNPPLQTIPRTKAIRQCFVAEPGWTIIKADYSQIELRILAQVSGDDRLINAYRNGEDIHRLTASLITGKSLAEVTEEDRRLAKAVNFGVIYGMGAARLKSSIQVDYELEITLDEAKAFIKQFFQAFPGVKQWHNKIRQSLYQRNVRSSRTLAGRRRRWKTKPRFSELLNHPIQGLNADISKQAIADLVEKLLPYNAKLISMVHDEILVECPISVSDKVAAIVKRAMIKAAKRWITHLPCDVDIQIATTWGGKVELNGETRSC